MRLLLIFVTLTLGYCLAAPERVAERVPKKTCEPGTTWKEECHSCVCSKEGKIDCTKEACPPQLVPRSKRSLEKQDCKEGETWKEDCHNCFCASGKPACTKELCESEASPKAVLLYSDDEINDHQTTKREAECVEGDVWKDDCHTCHCTYGRKACTRELCPSEADWSVTVSEDNERTKRDHDSVEDTSSSEEERCPPNLKEWKEDCNHCYCDKGEKVCTRALCPDQGPVVAIDPKQ